MVAGAPFPEIYDWTWGEILEFVKCHEEAELEKERLNASMYFTTAALIPKLIGGQRGQKFTVMDEYSFLWSKEELKKLKNDRIEAKFRVANDKE